MAEFEDLQNQLAAARKSRATLGVDLLKAREAASRMKRQRDAAERRGDRGQLGAIDAEIEAREARARETRVDLDRSRAAQDALIAEFAEFSDPREQITRLDDRLPICLLPVRMEVRFKPREEIVDPIRDNHGEMWVRIYPDDISVDSFEETLTEIEAADARRYWTAHWAAGGQEADERAAWRALHAGQGAGRSFWITQTYTPLNPEDRPAPPDDAPWVILTIATDASLVDPEHAAVLTYWEAIWRAGDDLAARTAATAALVAATNDARALELIETYRPDNLSVQPPEGATRAETQVFVSILTFPTADAAGLRQAGWATTPTADILPERFVLLGFNDGEVTLNELGARVPDSVSVAPDPSADEADQIKPDGAEIDIPDEMLWLTDFPRAVEDGLGFRIPLDGQQFRRGFDELCVLGLRLSDTAEQSRAEMERLIQHKNRSKSGFSIVPQGRPTNNVERVASDYSWREDSDISFEHYFGDAPDDPTAWFEKRDGRWLAEMLGLSPDAINAIPFYSQPDICDAKAMNIALWPATLGYFMESALHPMFETGTIERTRNFFARHVTARGTIPAIRVGPQPYGILPVTPRSRSQWWSTLVKRQKMDRRQGAFLANLHRILQQVEGDMTPLLDRVSQVGVGQAADRQQALLDVVGLHPTSAEFQQRYAESLQQLYNRLAMSGAGGVFLAFVISAAAAAAGIQLLESFGYTHDPEGENPDILEKFFTGAAYGLYGGLVDDRPVSETEALRVVSEGGENYVAWLRNAAATSHDTLRKQEGFTDGVPRPLLYQMLRHALDLSFVETSITLFHNAGLISTPQREALRREPAFLQVANAQEELDLTAAGGSRWRHLYAREATITGSGTSRIGDFIPTVLTSMQATAYLNRQLGALDHLSQRPTAALERCAAEHIDLCTYRLDAWYGGLMSRQLEWMRFGSGAPRRDIDLDGDGLPDPGGPDRDQGRPTGLYIGAWGWLENIKPDFRRQDPATVPRDFEDAFDPTANPPLTEDSQNQGYIHAPSLNHAVTAAILRNGYLSNATPDQPDALAINLSSRRVRTALQIIEGLKANQNLGALLGYYFERWLHDRHDVEVDEYILDLRKAFPLAGNRLKPTRVSGTDEANQPIRIKQVEARNVIDGLAFVEHLKTAPQDYPFGLPDLPEQPTGISGDQADAISEEARRLRDIADAVADLAMAEAVHQVAQGNYDRAGAVLDTYSKGKFPQTPDVIRTPRSGTTLSHRVALHLPVGLDPNDPARLSPRARTEPALDVWLATVLPNPDRVACAVTVTDPTGGPDATHVVTQTDLGLAPLDLLYLLDPDDEKSSRALEDRIEVHIRTTHTPRPEAVLSISYRDRLPAVPDHVPFFELSALVRQLRGLVLRSRPLRPTDMSTAAEARDDQDLTQTLDPQRLTLARDALAAGRDQIAALEAVLVPQFDADPRDDATIISEAETRMTAFITALEAISPFAALESGTGALYADLSDAYSALQAALAEHLPLWDDQLAAFDAAIAAHDADPGADAEAQIQRLIRADRLLRSEANTPTPADPVVYRTLLVDTDRPAFVAARDAFVAIGATQATASGLHNALVAAVAANTTFAVAELDVSDGAGRLATLSEDILRRSVAMNAALTGQVDAVQAKIDEADAAGDTRARIEAQIAAAHLLFGDDFIVIPSFTLAPIVGTEWRQAWGPGVAASTALLAHQTVTLGRPFPVEDWLTGIARVRDKMGQVETVIHLAEAFGTTAPGLQPLQFPHRPNTPWLALEYPDNVSIDEDKILYTGLFATPFDEGLSQAGLFLDDWTETIPSLTEDTGLAFHYDRPNSEPPQSILLALPADFTGAWSWEDLVDSIRETMDLARRRAIEPDHIDQTAYARFLPAILASTTLHPITASLNFAFNNGLADSLQRVNPDE